jgi:guanylate kinase
MTDDAEITRRGIMLVLSSPSGAGKTTLSRNLLEQENIDDPGKLELSVSATTRPRRPSEIDGVHYHFVGKRQFETMRDRGELLEWAEVHGNYYGTPRSNLDEAVARAEFLLLDIDVQGARQIRLQAPDALHLFVLPPSGRELMERLLGRGSETGEVRQRRLRNACAEVREAAEFDYVVVNDDLDATVDTIEGILASEAHRVRRIPHFTAALDRLCDEIRHHTEPLAGGAENTSPTLE